MSRKLIKITLLLLVAVALFYGGTLAYLLIAGDRVVFTLVAPTYSEETCQFLAGRNGGRIAYRYAANPNARYTLLYSHGSSGDMGMLNSHVEAHRRFGFNVLIYDYPGVGLSAGPVSEQGCYDTVEDIFALAKTLGATPETTIAYGRSIGTGPSLYLAERYPVAGVILVSPFTSALGVEWMTRLFPIDKFRNAERIPSVHSKVLILHGKNDENIPYTEAEKLHALAPPGAALRLVEGRGHKDLHLDPEYWRALNEFVRDL